MAFGLNTYNTGDTDYIAKMNADNANIENAINNLQTSTGTGGSGSLSSSNFLTAIFGSTATIIGLGGYAATISGSTLTLTLGIAWKPSSSTVVQNATTVGLNFGGQPAGTYYIVPDASGAPTIQTSSSDAIYSIVWDGSAVLSALTRVGNLFYNAADEATWRHSTTLGADYASLLSRLEAIEAAEGGGGTGSIFTSIPVSASGAMATPTFAETTYLATGGSGGITLTLPAPGSIANKRITVKKVDSAAGGVTIAQHASETIDGDTAYDLLNPNQYVTLETDGTNWFVVGESS